MLATLHLQDESFINLITLRKNGLEVATPVWAAGNDQVLYVFSESKAGKVKRLRNFSNCKVQACTSVGEPTGYAFPAQARLIDDQEEIQLAYKFLERKYGWQVSLLNGLAKISGKYEKRAMIRIELDR